MKKEKLEKAEEILKKYNQKEVIELLDKLDDDKKETLTDSVLNVDFDSLTKLFNKSQEKEIVDNVGISPMNAIIKEDVSEEKNILS